MALLETLTTRARALKRETSVLYLAMRDPRTPWYAKAVAAVVVAYAFSPLDLIPDFIPIVGYLDDLILVPIGIALALKLVPATVIADCRARAQADEGRPVSRVGAAVIIAIWLIVAGGGFLFLRNLLAARDLP